MTSRTCADVIQPCQGTVVGTVPLSFPPSHHPLRSPSRETRETTGDESGISACSFFAESTKLSYKFACEGRGFGLSVFRGFAFFTGTAIAAIVSRRKVGAYLNSILV